MPSINADAIAVCLAGRRAMLEEIADIHATLTRLLPVAAAGGLRAEFDDVRAHVTALRVAILAEIQTLSAMAPHRLTLGEAVALIACWLGVFTECAALESEINVRTAGHFTEGEIAAVLDAYREQSAAWRRETLAAWSAKLVACAAEPW